MIAGLKPYPEDRESGVPEPEIRLDSGFRITVIRRKTDETVHVTPQVTEQVTKQVRRILFVVAGAEAGTQRLMELLHLSHRPTFLYDYLQPAVRLGMLEMTQPDSPHSPSQKYRLTEKGRDWFAAQGGRA